ncbi:hypothetical protein QVD17_33493 [Tagetes erecta]|uniref:Uncharacterized protein n=1 Tax=Tagetes erecta TaxID=13708 RepID=A0AAD8JWT7_TARER|nr:hypothetical protein QVD17_33493 [Tagetes erecta]
MVWADDENDQWVYYNDPDLQQKQSLLTHDHDNRSQQYAAAVSVHANCNNNKEVKIMVSKRKLEELLEDLHHVPVNQILDRLISSSDRFQIDHVYVDDDDHHQQQHPWKPNLQSIPEEN